MHPVSNSLKEQKDHGTLVFPCGLYEVFEDTLWPRENSGFHGYLHLLILLLKK